MNEGLDHFIAPAIMVIQSCVQELVMKKFLIVGLALLFFGSVLHAEDARLMPFRVGRTTLSTSFSFGDKQFDSDGKRVDAPAIKLFNLGGLMEFGALHWLTAAVYWAPGYYLWSDLDIVLGTAGSSVNLFDTGDLMLGAKLQILGSTGLINNESFRLSLSPGLKIPLPGPNYEKQLSNMQAGDPVTVANMDYHVFGLALGTYFDFVINQYFSINLYNQVIYYPQKKSMKEAGLEEYGDALLSDIINSALNGYHLPNLISYGGVSYGYDLSFEVEPAFNTVIANGILLYAGLPIMYKTSSGKKIDMSYNAGHIALAGVIAADPLNKALIDKIDKLERKQSHLLTLKPAASVFFYGWKLPFEFRLSYFIPLWGQNITSAAQTFSFQAKVYFKI